MSVLSKLFDFCSEGSCHELGHTWSPSCTGSAWGIFRSCALESVKIYGVLYMVAALIRKEGLDYYKLQYLLDVLRSSLFLAVNGGGFIANFCLVRKILGGFSYISLGFIPALIASFTAILIEKKSRRGVLMMYMLNLAVETMYNMLKQRSIISPIPYGEVILFCSATSVLMYLYRKNGLSNGVLKSLVRFLFGSDTHTPKPMYESCEDHQQSDPSSIDLKVDQLFKLWIKPTVRTFTIGYTIQMLPSFVMALLSLRRRPGQVFKSLYKPDNFRLGFFLGSFVGIFKIAEQLLGTLRKQQDEMNALIAGALSGLSMLCYRSSTISLYIASKVAEVLYKKGISSGILPAIPHTTIWLYTICTAFIFHACCWECHNVRPSYWRYLNVVTHKRFCELNRIEADKIFGTESAKLFPKEDLYMSLKR